MLKIHQSQLLLLFLSLVHIMFNIHNILFIPLALFMLVMLLAVILSVRVSQKSRQSKLNLLQLVNTNIFFLSLFFFSY